MERKTVGRRTIKRGSARQVVDGKGFRLADEIAYIQDKAADHDGRIVTIGQLILFSTDTGDAWLLDVTDQLAARLARDGDPEQIYLGDRYQLRHRMEGPLSDRGARFHLRRPHHRPRHDHPRLPHKKTRSRGLTLTRADLEISNIFG
jgi:hypothetical protein